MPPITIDSDIDLSGAVDLIVLSIKERAARCRLPGTECTITLRSTGLWAAVPGGIVTVRPRKHWRYAGHPYLSGEIEGTRLDVAALGLTPLRLEPFGTWDPVEEYWGEEGDAIDDWARSIIAQGPRPEFEMEQVLPGSDLNDPDIDPIIESNDLKDAGGRAGARRILMALLETDLYGRPWLGSRRQSPVPALHEGLRSLPLASRPTGRCRANFRSPALDEPGRQSGHSVSSSGDPRRQALGGFRLLSQRTCEITPNCRAAPLRAADHLPAERGLAASGPVPTLDFGPWIRAGLR